MRPKSIILLVLALGCGLVASIGINEVIRAQSAPQVVMGETVGVLVANQDINIGDPLTPKNVNIAPWPKDQVPPGSFTKIEDIDNRRARQKLFKGEQLLESKLLGKGDNGGSPIETLPPGMRLVTVKVDAESSGAGLIKVGDHIDILVSLAENPAKGILKPQTISPKDLHNLKIFAIDSIYNRDGNGEQTVVAKTISLAASPAQSKLIRLATQLGDISLVGRNPLDATKDLEDDQASVDVEDLLKGMGSGGGNKNGGGNSLLEAIQQVAPKLTEAPVETAPEPLAIAPAANRDVMIIREGPMPRQVIFENGVPIDLGVETSDSETPAADVEPAPEASKNSQ